MFAPISRRSILQAAILLPGAALLSSSLLAASAKGFTHCVASGDPQQESVVLWTRYVGSGDRVDLRVEVAKDAAFTHIVTRGTAAAGPGTDYCAHTRAKDLVPGQWYYYRFLAPDGESSPIGRTRTLPAGPLDRFRIGVFSCSNATSGWFNAYAHAAAREDLDLILHLGDYIYESPVDRSDALEELAVSRGIQPLGEAVSLMDYRLRYASYRSDPALRELHRLYPMITIWDDHESANNAWKDGARNHDSDEGPWPVRKAAAMRAFHEWLPMDQAPYQQYRIGQLASLYRLETRLLARSQQLELKEALAGRRDLAGAVRDFRNGPLADPRRTMMGVAQENWLSHEMARSVAAGTRWQVLAQQVILAPTRLPTVSPHWFAPGTVFGPDEEKEIATTNSLAELGMPLGLDRWDGYPAARDRLLQASVRAGGDLVVLSGDSHNAWAYDLTHEGKPAGVEFAVQGVSSLGLDKRFGGDPRAIARDFVEANPGLKWCDTSHRGYMVVDLSPARVASEWLFLPSRKARSTELLGSARLAASAGSRQLTTL